MKCDCESGCPDCLPIATDISEPWRYPETDAHIAATMDWNPTCLPGQEREAIVRQIRDRDRDRVAYWRKSSRDAWGGLAECASQNTRLRARVAELHATLAALVSWWDAGDTPGAVRIAPRAIWDRARAEVQLGEGLTDGPTPR